MPDSDVAADPRLVDDLQRYFAITTAADLPRGVRTLSVRTLQPRPRRPVMRWLMPFGTVAAAAVVVLLSVTAHRGAGNGGTALPQFAAGSTSSLGPTGSDQASKAAAGSAAPAVAYPGVDPALLQTAGRTRLLAPAARDAATFNATAARVVALTSQLADLETQGAPGPAVLAWVEDAGPVPVRCFCYVVGVPVAGPASTDARSRTVLVYVDAVTGAVAGTRAAPGTA